MRPLDEERILAEAVYICETDSTLRVTAKAFQVSLSTVHRDVRKVLPTLNPLVASTIDDIMKRHIVEGRQRAGRKPRKDK